MGEVPKIVYQPRADVTPESECDVLANVLRFVLDRQASRKAAGQSGQEDAKEAHDVRAGTILPPQGSSYTGTFRYQ
jgi:hypothetical protein